MQAFKWKMWQKKIRNLKQSISRENEEFAEYFIP